MSLRRLTPLSAPFALFVLLGATLSPREASAFERQWHLGAAASFVAPNQSRANGYGAGLYASYGMSDVFDVRAELRSSFHEKLGDRGAFSLHTGALGLCYKLDILEWIPYLGVRAGYFEQAGGLGGWDRRGGFVGGFAGVDHAFSRSWAAGVEVATDQLLAEGLLSAASFRVEYRWGY